MPWVRFDDQFPIHRKVDGLSDTAYRLHTSAIFWCARNLTDGFVSEEDLGGVTARVRAPSRFAAECVHREVWHDARFQCPSPKCPAPVDGDGWVIHDYWEYQPTKEQVLRDREANARRQEKWRQNHNAVSNGVTPPVDNPEIRSRQSPPRNQGRSAGIAPDGRNASSNAVTNACSKSTPSRPVTNTGPYEPERPPRARDPSQDPPNVNGNSQASRLPSARSLAEAERAAGIGPGHRPASEEAKTAAAEQARRALNRRKT